MLVRSDGEGGWEFRCGSCGHWGGAILIKAELLCFRCFRQRPGYADQREEAHRQRLLARSIRVESRTLLRRLREQQERPR